MISGPHGTAMPPAILIAYHPADQRWHAMAVLAEDRMDFVGSSTSSGRHPVDALQSLFEKRFCALSDSDFPATLISIEVHDPVFATNPTRVGEPA